jgi:hypothetical protein
MFNCGIKALIAREVLRIQNPDVQMTGKQVLTTLDSKMIILNRKKNYFRVFPKSFFMK